MWNSGIISSRHREQDEYFLRLNNVNQDYVVQDSGNYNFTNISYGVTVDTTGLNTTTTQILIAKGGNTVTTRSGLSLGGGNLTMLVGSSDLVRYSDLLIDYPNQIVEIKAIYRPMSQGSCDILVNDNIVASITTDVRPTNQTNVYWFVGGRSSGVGTPIADEFFLNADIHSFFVDSDVYECNEGSGFAVSNTTNTNQSTGYTSNVGGLTYWNNNVWQPT